MLESKCKNGTIDDIYSPWFTVCSSLVDASLFDCILEFKAHHRSFGTTIAKFMGSTWGPSGAGRTQVGPMLAPWTSISENITIVKNIDGNLGVRYMDLWGTAAFDGVYDNDIHVNAMLEIKPSGIDMLQYIFTSTNMSKVLVSRLQDKDQLCGQPLLLPCIVGQSSHIQHNNHWLRNNGQI